MHTKIEILLTAFVIALLLPLHGWTAGEGPAVAAVKSLFEQGQPFEQDLVITAYYSPMPDQCCYIKGSLAADIILNGEGHHGADGTAVYPGMVAAPSSYPFGTRLVVPGIGTVTVHDRGGAIQEWKSSHRLDIWVGYGEEGLARALEFGVKRVRAVVYPPSSPKPAESIDLSALPAPADRLTPYRTPGTTLFDISAKAGQQTASVMFLQEKLGQLGYFGEKANGSFGPATQKALGAFYADLGLDEPVDHLSETGAALLEAALRRKSAKEPIASVVDAGSAPARIAEAQRTLRFLGFYHGRTNGQYDGAFKAAVTAFQKQQGIIGADTEPGAGRIGPQTRKTIVALWRRTHVEKEAGRLIALRRIDTLLAERGYVISGYLEKGDKGASVRSLQKFLAMHGFLQADAVTGTFGATTEEALTAYQQHAGIIKNDSDAGAGYAGPATLARFRQDVRQSLLNIVRAQGWEAI